MKRLLLISAGVIALLLLWRFGPFRSAVPVNRAGEPDSKTAQAANARAPDSSAVEPRRLAPPERSPLADNLNSPAQDIRADLKIVADIIDTFRTNFLQTGNPVGTNAEITDALTGRNKLRLSLIPLDHPAINKNGELCDRWGTPFFFHAESATRMEIRSAGPDKKLWNADDVVFTP